MITASFIPAKLNPPVWKGSTFRYKFQWIDAEEVEGKEVRTPHNVTGFSGELLLLGPAGETLFELTSGNGGVKFPEPTQGYVELYIDAEDTTGFEWKKAYYTLFLYEPGGPKDTYAMLTGVFTVSTPGVIQ